jgi:DNA-binding HxlR family transcriptional regulator
MTKFGNYGIIKVPQEILAQMNACPVDTGFKILGHKFMVLILRDMILFKKKRFAELLQSVEGISAKTLTIRLNELEKTGMINKKVYHSSPVREEYILTKKGKMLRPLLEQMAAYSISYCSEIVFDDKKRRTFKEIVGRPPSALDK